VRSPAKSARRRRFGCDGKKRKEISVAIHRELGREGCLCHHVDALLEKTCERASNLAPSSFGQWATAQHQRILKRFFKASPSDLHDLASLHRFRIRGKELRYAMELLAPAFPAAFREQLYPVVEQLQERLGEIHDHAVARTRFGEWSTEAKSKRAAAHVRKLLKVDHRLSELFFETRAAPVKFDKRCADLVVTLQA
jgi:CHAD domain-containing protein